MRIVSLIARILLGVLFVFAGLMGFFSVPPAMPGIVGALTHDLYVSHWSFAVAFAQLVSGILLLINRYVTLALVILGAFLYNSLAFHALTLPVTLPIPIAVVIVWLLACWPYRAAFAAFFTAKPS